MPAHTYRQRGGLLARWQPASLITGDVIAIKLTLGVWALIRAEDYAHGVRDNFPMLEAAFPFGHHKIAAGIGSPNYFDLVRKP